MFVARMDSGDEVELPDSPFVHLFVARGAVSVEDTALSAGDAARLTAAGALPVIASEDAEIIVWATDAEAAR